MSRAVILLPCIPSWRGTGHLYLLRLQNTQFQCLTDGVNPQKKRRLNVKMKEEIKGWGGTRKWINKRRGEEFYI